MSAGERVLQNVTVAFTNSPKAKRRREDCPDNFCRSRVKVGSTFLSICAGADLFQTEDWQSSDSAIFIPLKEDMMVRVQSYDKVTFSNGIFFYGDEQGRYMGSIAGRVIHMWRYNTQTHKLYISLSFLCTDLSLYEEMCQGMSSL